MVKNYLSRVKNRFKKEDPFQRKLADLRRLPRYTEGAIEMFGKQLSFPDAASFSFTYEEIFQNEIYRFPATSNAPFIIDCGANIGLSVLYFKLNFPQSRIIAFEPERKIFQYLKNNVAPYQFQDVALVDKAVWEEDEMLQFSNEGADASRLSELDSGDNFISSYDVQAVRLSPYITEPVDFLKLDIEGAEIAVLKEIEPKLGFVKRIFIEFHSFYNRGQELDVILRILSKNNFRYYLTTPANLRQRPFVDVGARFLSFDNFVNVFAIKED